MLSDVARALVRILPVMHAALCVWLYVPEFGTCENMNLPYEMVSNDLTIARTRAKEGTYFHAATAIDLLSMMLIVAAFRVHGARHDLYGLARWLPVVMLVSNLAFRVRYTFGTSEDRESCGGLKCPVSRYSMDMEGCYNSDLLYTFEVDWRDRDNWCALPRWYQLTNAASVCRGLENTPDVASCYRYGCTKSVPHRYVGVRMIIMSSFLFAIAALVPYSRMHRKIS